MQNRFAPLAAAALMALHAAATVPAQQPPPPQGGRQTQTIQGGGGQGIVGGLDRPAAGPKLPVPRRPDGRVIIGATATEKGVWNAGAGGLGRAEDVPYQPWARALRAERARH